MTQDGSINYKILFDKLSERKGSGVFKFMGSEGRFIVSSKGNNIRFTKIGITHSSDLDHLIYDIVEFFGADIKGQAYTLARLRLSLLFIQCKLIEQEEFNDMNIAYDAEYPIYYNEDLKRVGMDGTLLEVLNPLQDYINFFSDLNTAAYYNDIDILRANIKKILQHSEELEKLEDCEALTNAVEQDNVECIRYLIKDFYLVLSEKGYFNVSDIEEAIKLAVHKPAILNIIAKGLSNMPNFDIDYNYLITILEEALKYGYTDVIKTYSQRLDFKDEETEEELYNVVGTEDNYSHYTNIQSIDYIVGLLRKHKIHLDDIDDALRRNVVSKCGLGVVKHYITSKTTDVKDLVVSALSNSLDVLRYIIELALSNKEVIKISSETLRHEYYDNKVDRANLVYLAQQGFGEVPHELTNGIMEAIRPIRNILNNYISKDISNNVIGYLVKTPDKLNIKPELAMYLKEGLNNYAVDEKEAAQILQAYMNETQEENIEDEDSETE